MKMMTMWVWSKRRFRKWSLESIFEDTQSAKPNARAHEEKENEMEDGGMAELWRAQLRPA
jgi:hypothetical protein